VERQRAEPDKSLGIRGDRLGDPVIGDARESQADLRVGPVETLMDEACAQHLHVHAHRVHLCDALGDVAHPGQNCAGTALDLVSHFVGDPWVNRQFGKNIVLGRYRIDLGHDDVGVEIDHVRACWQIARHSPVPIGLPHDTIVSYHEPLVGQKKCVLQAGGQARRQPPR